MADEIQTEAEMLRQREALQRGLWRTNFAWGVIVVVIGTLAGGVVWKAEQSEREAARANENARQAAQAATRANAELWNARFTEVRASRIAGGSGARIQTFDVITELARSPGLGEDKRQALRTEAIALMAMVDIRLPKPDPVPMSKTNTLRSRGPRTYDASMQRYVPSRGVGNIEIFDSATGTRLSTLAAPQRFVRELAVFSEDGRYLAGVFPMNPARVLAWRLSDGALVVSNLTASAGGFNQPLFSPNSSLMGVFEGDLLKLFDLESSNAPPRWIPAPSLARFGPQPGNLAVVLKTNVEVWSLDKAEIRSRLSPGFTPSAIAWHPSGRQMALGGTRGELALWTVPPDGADHSEATVRRLDGHWGRIVTLEYSPEGDHLLTWSWDGFSALWDTRSGRPLLNERRVQLARFGATVRELQAETRSGGRQRIPLLERSAFRTVISAGNPGKPLVDAVFSPDGAVVATDHLGHSKLWDSKSGHELARVPGRSPLFLPDNDSILTCTESGLFRFSLAAARQSGGSTNLVPGTELLHRNRAAFPRDRFNTISLAPDKRTVVISATDSGVILFDLAGEHPVRRQTNVIAHFAEVSADGEWLVTQYHNANAYLVRMTNPARARAIALHANTRFSPDGRRLAVASDRVLALHMRDASNGWSTVGRIPIEIGPGNPMQLAFSPDSRSVAVSTNRFDIQLLDATSGRALAVLTTPFRAPLGGARSLAFSPDGRHLRAFVGDGEAIEWNLETMRADLARLGLDWGSGSNTNSALALDPPGSMRLGRAGGGDGVLPAYRSSFPALVAGVAGLIALAAGIIVFTHQRRLIASHARAETLAIEQQRQLAATQQALFQSQKMEALGTLAAGVAHDFNNLLSIIRMSNQLVHRAVKPEGQTRENLDAIEQAVHQGKSLVNSLLGYSRRPADVVEDFSVPQVVSDTASLLSRQFLGGLTVRMDLDPACPLINGARARLEQVLLNLLVNASEAMKGSGELTLVARPLNPGSSVAGSSPGQAARSTRVLARQSAGPGVELTIGDSGPGIPPEVLPRIFEPFFTTKNAGVQRGTGLGLSLVYTIAKQDGWGLGVRTEAGRGTVFVLEL